MSSTEMKAEKVASNRKIFVDSLRLREGTEVIHYLRIGNDMSAMGLAVDLLSPHQWIKHSSCKPEDERPLYTNGGFYNMANEDVLAALDITLTVELQIWKAEKRLNQTQLADLIELQPGWLAGDPIRAFDHSLTPEAFAHE